MKKHAWTISWVLIGAMVLAALVRLGLAPDIPMVPGNPLLGTKGMWLLGLPAFQGLMLLIQKFSLRSMRGTPEAIQAWREYWGAFHLGLTVFLAVCQALMLFNSLGIQLPLPKGLWLGRFFLVFSGLGLMAMFNRLPKMPRIESTSHPSPDLMRWPQMARLISWIVVGLGIILVLTGLVGPTPQTAPFLSVLSTSFVALALLAIVYHFWRWHWARTK